MHDFQVRYAGVSAEDTWVQQGTTMDGRPWYMGTGSGGLLDSVRYLYYSTRAQGYLLTATRPQTNQAEPWVGGNNQVRLVSGGASSPAGTWTSARLYCGHDTGAPARGCSSHDRGNGQTYYWCDNVGSVTVSCTDDTGASAAVHAVDDDDDDDCVPVEEERPAFSFHAERKTYAAARADCQQRGGDIASIHSAEENAQAASLVGLGSDAWIGFTDQRAEGTWVWSDGSPVVYTNWAGGEPNSYLGDEDCAVFWSGGEYGRWYDGYGSENCDAALPYVCRGAAPAPPAPPSPFAYFAEAMSFSAAREHCQSLGGDLASIRSAEENYQAHRLVPAGARAYIGYHDRVSEGSFAWTDGWGGSYTNWGPSEPNSWGGTDEDCAGFHIYYSSGQWNDFPCGGHDVNDDHAPIGHVCRLPLSEASNNAATDSASSEERDGGGGAARFEYVPNVGSWDAGRAACQQRGGDLASIHSDAENAAAWATVPQGTGAWIGLSDTAHEGTWVWADGTAYDFVKFQAQEPNQGTNENCAGFYRDFGGEWADGYCAGTDQWWRGSGAVCRLAGDHENTHPPRLCQRRGAVALGDGGGDDDDHSKVIYAAMGGGVILVVAGLLVLFRLSTKRRGGTDPTRANVSEAGRRAPVSPTAAAPPVQAVLATPLPVHGGFGGGNERPTLASQVEVLKYELRLSGSMQHVVHEAAVQLGVESAGRSLIELANACVATLRLPAASRYQAQAPFGSPVAPVMAVPIYAGAEMAALPAFNPNPVDKL